MTIRQKKTRGSVLLEFCLAGVVLIFVWISVVEISRGMWNYHTLQYAAKVAGAYASVHGANCTVSPNTCTTSISNIATVFRNTAIGVPASAVSMTFTTDSGTATTCNLGGASNLCSSQTSTWPPSNDSQVGKKLSIKANYPFQSAIAMLVPGRGSMRFASVTLSGSSSQIIQY